MNTKFAKIAGTILLVAGGVLLFIGGVSSSAAIAVIGAVLELYLIWLCLLQVCSELLL